MPLCHAVSQKFHSNSNKLVHKNKTGISHAHISSVRVSGKQANGKHNNPTHKQTHTAHTAFNRGVSIRAVVAVEWHGDASAQISTIRCCVVLLDICVIATN